MRKLISFDITIKQDVCTYHCKNLKNISAIMTFKIAETGKDDFNQESPALSAMGQIPNGYVTRIIECSIEEVK